MNTKLMSIVYFLVLPISKLWESIYWIRRFFYDVGVFKQNHFKVPVISVGNLTLGGTGKTPFTLWLGNYLNSIDKKVMVLTRGYKGNLEHSSGIIKTGKTIGHNPYAFGDEALVLCRGMKNASVVVGKKRSENLKHYFETEKPDVVLLDDGHQHLMIDRKLNIVLFDSLLSIDRYKAPPLGYLREGMTALKDADLVVFGRADIVSQEKLDDLKQLVEKYTRKGTPLASFYYAPTDIKDINYHSAMSPEELKDKKVICISGVASPKSFYELLKSLGADIINTYQFPDHHYYTDEELAPIVAEAKKEEAIIISTEKDIVKLRRVSESGNIYYVEISIKFLSGESEVKELVNQVIY
ncbi:MAG: tetraacyldisaccharide 4'-kinase [Bacteriovorax sp. MedPE-SWde]|nr:MAG: tetraacyldisaccharide 4'-kinase [Bacteriovorax sp. MedPE-SWde]